MNLAGSETVANIILIEQAMMRYKFTSAESNFTSVKYSFIYNDFGKYSSLIKLKPHFLSLTFPQRAIRGKFS